MDHTARRLLKTRLADVMAGFFMLHHGVDVNGQLAVGSPGLHPGGHVVVKQGEQAGPDFSVGIQANPPAVSSKGVENPGHYSLFSEATLILVPPHVLPAPTH